MHNERQYLNIYRRFPTFDTQERIKDMRDVLCDFLKGSQVLHLDDAFICVVVAYSGKTVTVEQALEALNHCGITGFCSESEATAQKYMPCGMDSEFRANLEQSLAVVASHFAYVDAIYNWARKEDGSRKFTKREACAAFLHLPITHPLVDWYWAMHELRLGQSDAIAHRVGNDTR